MKPMIACGLVAVHLIAGCSGTETAGERWTPAQTPFFAKGPTVSPGAPSGPIGLRYESLGTPELGQPLQIRIAVFSQFPVTALAAQVYANEGLIVTPQNFSVSGLESQQSAERTLTVTPYLEGPLRFSLLVQGEIDGQLQAGQLTVPVQVGEGRPEPTPMGTLSTDESGEAIISLPAREN